MTETGDYAVSDHTHAENWVRANRAPNLASPRNLIHKCRGQSESATAVSNYGFLDGHASTHRFDVVYLDGSKNRFNPEIAN